MTQTLGWYKAGTEAMHGLGSGEGSNFVGAIFFCLRCHWEINDNARQAAGAGELRA